ncbi:MAG: M48 family metallopeptidase [Lachnospiraceae bacterium]
MNIELIRSNRKTMIMEITGDGRIIIRAPFEMPQTEIERFIQDKAVWIEKNLAKAKQRQKEHVQQSKLSMDEIRDLADEALRVIPERTAFYAQKIGVSYGRITIRNQKSRWGSCSGKGNLNFNCLLMLTPQEVQDYVIVHELCHRKEMNHSDRFWSEVEKILPDYRKQRAWLKEHGGDIIGRML